MITTEKLKNEVKKVIDILKKDGIGVIPTDTVYGIVGKALSKKTVQRLYKIKKRNPKKPFIILIRSLNDLKIFQVKTSKEILDFLKKIWPGKITVILPLKNKKKFFYLHKGTNSLAFRIPEDKILQNILKKTGPLVAPSANLEGEVPAETISQAKRYFKEKVDFYFNGGKRKGKPSIILEVKRL